MTRRKKQLEHPLPHEFVSEGDTTLQEFTDIVVESMKEEHSNQLEPFELYAQKLRSHLHANVEEFHARFARGYQVLLEELSHSSDSRS